MRTTLVRLLLILAASAAWAPWLQAQTNAEPPFEACKPGAFTVIDYPDEYGPKAGSKFDVYIDDRFQGEFLTQQRIWLPSIVASIEKWNNISGATWRYENRGLTEQEFSLTDDRLTISACGGLFDCPDGSPPLPPGGPGGGVVDFFPQTTLAVTLVTEDSTAGKGIKNSDIFFNPAIPYEINPGPGEIDFESVLVHELGHALGLGHNDNCTSESTVMESLIDLAEIRRGLSGSEVEGVRFLYPEETAPSIRVYANESYVHFQSRPDGLPPFGQAVNIYGIRSHRWHATPSADWVTVEPPVGRFGVDDAVEIRVNPSGLTNGEYTATVSVRDENHPNGPPVMLNVSLEVTTNVSETDLPVLAQNGVVNGANQFSGRLAPGSLVTIYGYNLASGEAEATEFPLPRAMMGTQIVIDGKVAPLLYVSPNQVNAIVPNEAYAGRSGIILRNGFGQDRGTPLTLLPAAPELFLMDEQHVIALNPDGAVNGPDAPAAPGQYVTIFFTGLGWTHPFVGTGEPAPGDNLAVPQAASKVFVAGVDTEVYFIGMTPGFAGLAQANVEIPSGFSGRLPVQIQIGGEASNIAFITVQ